MIPQEWEGQRVEVELIQAEALEVRWGTLEAVTDLGIVGVFSIDARPGSKVWRRFYPWSAVFSIDLSR